MCIVHIPATILNPRSGHGRGGPKISSDLRGGVFGPFDHGGEVPFDFSKDGTSEKATTKPPR